MASSISPGDWRLTAGCDCGAWIVIGASEGPASRITLQERYALTCDFCGKSANYGPERLRHARVAARSRVAEESQLAV
jgi:hypothetical protein